MEQIIHDKVKEKLNELDETIQKALDEGTLDAIITARCDIAISKVLGHRFHGFFADMAAEIASAIKIDDDFKKSIKLAVKERIKEEAGKRLDDWHICNAVEKAVKEQFPAMYSKALLNFDITNQVRESITERAKIYLESEIGELLRNEIKILYDQVGRMQETLNEMGNVKYQMEQHEKTLDDIRSRLNR